jgi:hypothetical protein
MKGFFATVANFVSETLHGDAYDRNLAQLVREENRAIENGEDPAKSRTCLRLQAEHRRLAEKHGRQHYPA